MAPTFKALAPTGPRPNRIFNLLTGIRPDPASMPGACQLSTSGTGLFVQTARATLLPTEHWQPHSRADVYNHLHCWLFTSILLLVAYMRTIGTCPAYANYRPRVQVCSCKQLGLPIYGTLAVALSGGWLQSPAIPEPYGYLIACGLQNNRFNCNTECFFIG